MTSGEAVKKERKGVNTKENYTIKVYIERETEVVEGQEETVQYYIYATSMHPKDSCTDSEVWGEKRLYPALCKAIKEVLTKSKPMTERTEFTLED